MSDYRERVNNYARFGSTLDVDAVLINADMRGGDDHYLLPQLTYGISRRDCLLIFKSGEGYYLSHYARALEEAQACTQINCILVEDHLSETLTKLCRKHRAKRLGFSPMEMSAYLYQEIAPTQGITLIPWDIEESMRARRHHDMKEIEIMTAGQRIAEEAWLKLLENLCPGRTEKDIRQELITNIIRLGAKSYSCCIVSAGQHTSQVHWMASDSPVEKGDFIMFDFGCVYEGYCTDMTRTIALQNVSDEQRSVYACVLEAQQAAIEKAAPGIPCCEIHNAAVDVFKKYGLDNYFTHGIGHGVGRIIHEYPTINAESDDVLETGDLITVEPGLYLSDRFGVRIEDMLYLSAEGRFNLTNATKDLLIIG